MRIVDIFLSIPYFVLAVAIATVFGRSENSIIIVLGVTGWLAVARVVRASFLSLRKMEYTEAARALGFGRTRMIFGHLLPNASVPDHRLRHDRHRRRRSSPRRRCRSSASARSSRPLRGG